jgi:hypothetical protein
MDESPTEGEEPRPASGPVHAPPRAALAGHHGPHGPAHPGPPHHKPAPHPTQTRHTGPGGIYIPPPSQWFK